MIRLREPDYVFNKFDDSPFNTILKILYIKNEV